MPTDTVFSTYDKKEKININFAGFGAIFASIWSPDRVGEHKLMAQNTSTKGLKKEKLQKTLQFLHIAHFSITYMKLFRGPASKTRTYVETLRIELF